MADLSEPTGPTPSSDSVNIGMTERQVRLLLGALFLAGGVALAYRMGFTHESAWGWRLLLFPVFYQGVRFLYDYNTGTCPLKAEMGQRRLDGWLTVLGERIADPELAARIRAVSRRAIVRSAVLAAVMTAVAIAL